VLSALQGRSPLISAEMSRWPRIAWLQVADAGEVTSLMLSSQPSPMTNVNVAGNFSARFRVFVEKVSANRWFALGKSGVLQT
jgi:hypothetical protein